MMNALRELASRTTMATVARALRLTRPAVSQQISQLEEEMGVALTERRGRGVRLTYAGQASAGYVEKMLAVLDEAKTEMASLNREVAGTAQNCGLSEPCSGLAAARHTEGQEALAVAGDRRRGNGARFRGWQHSGRGALTRRGGRLLHDDRMEVEVHRKVFLAEDVLYVLLPSARRFATHKSLSIGDPKNER